MQVIDIKELLRGSKVTEGDSKALELYIAGLLLKIYNLSGVLKSADPAKVEKEIDEISEQLTIDILAEFKTLRVQEIGYCLMCGLKGHFETKTYGMNYPTFYKWIEAYFYSEERKEAINSIKQDRGVLQLTETNAPTEAEKRQMIIDSINESYADYLSGATTTEMSKLVSEQDICDYGNVKDNFLTREKKKPEGMKLIDFYRQCKKEKKTKIIDTELN